MLRAAVGRLCRLGAIGSAGAPAAWTPANLFAASEQGVWYDPSDVVTGWRRNLLTYTEQFDNAAWSKTNATVTPNATTAPDGTTTADKAVWSATTSGHSIANTNTAPAYATNVIVSFYCKAAELTRVAVGTSYGSVIVDLTTGTQVGTDVWSPGNHSATLLSCTDAGNGWWRIVTKINNLSRVLPPSACVRLVASTASGDLTNQQYTGDGTSGIYVWGAQLEYGTAATAYQPITDIYTEYLAADPQPVMFVDSAGSQPVYGVEQSVGLILDKSKGLTLGSDTGTDFSSSTGWTLGTGITISGGKLNFASVTAGANAQRTGGTLYTAGSTRLVTVVVDSISGGTINCTVASTGFSISAAGTFTARLTGAANNYLAFVAATGTVTAVIDSVTVQTLPGNHAYQSTSTSRPVLRARHNLLTYSEQFDNAAWTKVESSVDDDAETAPDGTSTADKLIESTASSVHLAKHSFTSVGGPISLSVYAKQAGRPRLLIRESDSTGNGACFDLSTGAVIANLGTGVGSITSVGNGWYRCSATFTEAAGTRSFGLVIQRSTDTGLASYTGDGSSGLYLWGAQLTGGAVLFSYQRIAAATDYATGPDFPLYLDFDGVDDSLVTANVDFSATDEMSVFAGVTKDNDSGDIVTELSASASISNYGVFYLVAGTDGSNVTGYTSLGKGFATVSASQASYSGSFPAPHTAVLSITHDISGDLSTMRCNGSSGTSGTGDKGSGNFGAAFPLYIGARGGTSLQLDGRIYSLIVRGAASTAGEITSAETYVAAKTGVTLP